MGNLGAKAIKFIPGALLFIIELALGVTDRTFEILLWGIATLLIAVGLWFNIPALRARVKTGCALLIIGASVVVVLSFFYETIFPKAPLYIKPDISYRLPNGQFRLFLVNWGGEAVPAVKYNISLWLSGGRNPGYDLGKFEPPMTWGIGEHTSRFTVEPGEYLVEITTLEKHFRQYLRIVPYAGGISVSMCVRDVYASTVPLVQGTCPAEFH